MTPSSETLLLRAAFVAQAAAHHRVSEYQLRRWWAAGLLPPATSRRSLGRGRGKEAWYAREGLDQLNALLRLRKAWRTDRPSVLRFVLWLEGWPVDWERVRAGLAADIREAARALHGRSGADVQAAEQALRARRRHWRPEELSDTAHILMQIAVFGRLPYPLGEPFDRLEPDEAQTGAGLTRLTGIDPKTFDRMVRGAPVTAASVIERFTRLSAGRAESARADLARAASDPEAPAQVRRILSPRQPVWAGVSEIMGGLVAVAESGRLKAVMSAPAGELP